MDVCQIPESHLSSSMVKRYTVNNKLPHNFNVKLCTTSHIPGLLSLTSTSGHIKRLCKSSPELWTFYSTLHQMGTFFNKKYRLSWSKAWVLGMVDKIVLVIPKSCSTICSFFVILKLQFSIQYLVCSLLALMTVSWHGLHKIVQNLMINFRIKTS